MSEQPKAETPKPDSITVRYSVHSSVYISDIEQEYGIKWEDVETWWVKYDELNLIVGGNEEEGEHRIVIPLQSYECDVDYKRPDSITVFDANYNAIEQR